ncbi:MAG: aminotransferase class I/II-fold pyridoxal phosphate-dependent enzyme [Candidatus Lokiarchaeota archaeon]|nr:aminotransferase class I/II-fold pyridoxal phosphate-dependent enzyme [Candidatus Lokiarchaeota archaeon]
MNFDILKKTPLYDVFSDLGKRIFLPDGIFYWSGRAKKEADINGTIGTAYGYEKDFIEGGFDDWVPCYLPEIKKYTKLSVNDIVPYASIGGLTDLRQKWKEFIIEKSLYDLNTEEAKIIHLKKYISNPIITAGVTNGIYLSGKLFLNSGESIICANKRWGNYDNIFKKNLGIKIKSFQFFKGKRLNLESLKDAIFEVGKIQNKIVIILNFPNNPTGYIPSVQEAMDLVKLIKESQVELKKPFVVIIDDAYEPYVFSDNALKNSIFYELQQLREDIIPVKLDGITKELLMYGARIGFVTIGLKPNWISNDTELEILINEINNKLEGINRSSISNCNHIYQAITEKIFDDVGFENIFKSRNKIIELLKERYEKINLELNKIDNPDITIDPNSGGFFLFINLNKEKYKAKEFGDYLLRTYKVGIIPIEDETEGINGFRIAYCSIDISQISEFINRIKAALINY